MGLFGPDHPPPCLILPDCLLHHSLCNHSGNFPITEQETWVNLFLPGTVCSRTTYSFHTPHVTKSKLQMIFQNLAPNQSYRTIIYLLRWTTISSPVRNSLTRESRFARNCWIILMFLWNMPGHQNLQWAPDLIVFLTKDVWLTFQHLCREYTCAIAKVVLSIFLCACSTPGSVPLCFSQPIVGRLVTSMRINISYHIYILR